MRLLVLAVAALAPAFDGCMADRPPLADLPPEQALFVGFAQECWKGTREVWLIDADGTIRHARMRRSSERNDTPPALVAEAEALGLLEGVQVNESIEHHDTAHMDEDDFRGLREKIAAADFPSLEESYQGSVIDGCNAGYYAWSDGQGVVVRDLAMGGPPELSEVGDFVRHAHVS